MPTNLPPEALKAEERYKAATTVPERIRTLEEFLSLIPKHKGTDKLRANLRKRLSQLKSEGEKKGGSVRHVSPYHIDREGAGQVVLLGAANSGKSSLVAALTHADPEVSIAPYATWEPTAGMMPIDNIQVQLIDTPPFSDGYVDPDMVDLLRRCDLILLVVDLQGLTIEQLEETAAWLTEHHILPTHRPEPENPDRHLIRQPVLVVVNKCDHATDDEDFAIFQELLGETWPDMAPLSSQTGRHVAAFKTAVFQKLNIIRIYSQPPGETVDKTAPFVLPANSTVAQFAAQVHKDFAQNLKAARIWGTGVYDGQMVGQDHILHDGDVVELRI